MNDIQLFANDEFELRITPEGADGPSQRESYRANAERHIYVIEFSSGIVKVGKTKHATKRLEWHAKSAQVHGVAIARSWVSDPHTGYGANELALIAFCAERWDISGGKEYFRDADFDQIVEFADELPQERLTEADIAALARRIDAAPSLSSAVQKAFQRIADANSASEMEGDCPWYAQFKKSQAWFDAEYPEGSKDIAQVGRHAWINLPDQHRAYALDIFFTDYWISLQEEEEEDRSVRQSDAGEFANQLPIGGTS